VDTNAEKLLLHRDRCLELAAKAPTEAIRARLLNIAKLYEVEVRLINRARRSIAESNELIAVAASLVGR
jgi:hypothetical protein